MGTLCTKFELPETFRFWVTRMHATCRGIGADEARLRQRHIGRTACRSAWQAAVSAECSCATNLPTSKYDHVSPLLKKLHWLRVPKSITFRLAVVANQCQHNMAPRYLTAQLQQASNVGYRQRLRSSSSAMLDVPRTEHVTIGGRAFSSTAARVWNSLPMVVQSSESLDIFRRCLKTELFERSYNWHRACQTTLLLHDSLSLSHSFLLWQQPWSLLTIILLWHSILIIIIIIIKILAWCLLWPHIGRVT